MRATLKATYYSAVISVYFHGESFLLFNPISSAERAGWSLRHLEPVRAQRAAPPAMLSCATPPTCWCGVWATL